MKRRNRQKFQWLKRWKKFGKITVGVLDSNDTTT